MMREEAILFSQGISRTGYSLFFFFICIAFFFSERYPPSLKSQCTPFDPVWLTLSPYPDQNLYAPAQAGSEPSGSVLDWPVWISHYPLFQPTLWSQFRPDSRAHLRLMSRPLWPWCSVHKLKEINQFLHQSLLK